MAETLEKKILLDIQIQGKTLADLKKDLPIVFVGLVGGLVIESWGTQTELWVYYTFERPPLWIIPAWPIASLSIDRLYRLMNLKIKFDHNKILSFLYWIVFIGFYHRLPEADTR